MMLMYVDGLLCGVVKCVDCSLWCIVSELSVVVCCVVLYCVVL